MDVELDQLVAGVNRLRTAYDRCDDSGPEFAELGGRLAELEHLLGMRVVSTAGAPDHRPLRALVVEILDVAQVPVFSSQLADLVFDLYRRDVAPERFGTLAADERRSLRKTQTPRRSSWLGHTILNDGDAYLGVRRCWASGDWPLTERVVMMKNDPSLSYRQVNRFADLALRIGVDTDVGGAWARQAVESPVFLTVPPSELAWMGPEDAVRWSQARAKQLLDPHDAGRRADLAARLAGEPLEVQLFGHDAAPR